MHLHRRQLLSALAGFGTLAALPRQVRAADYPQRPVKLVVPWPAGGVVDIAARIVSDSVSTSWGQQIVVENRPGANGNIGTQAVKAAAADGYTLLAGSLSLAVNPLIDPNARFATQDFEAIVQIGAAPNLLVVPATSPAATLADFIALARQHPGRFNTPNPGIGSSNHLGLEILQQAAGIELQQVSYKGQPPFIVDLASGQLHFAYLTSALALPHVTSGRLRALAVVSGTRLKALPAVPTLAEAGYPAATVLPWNGVFAPAGTPRDVTARIAHEVQKALRSADVLRRYEAINAELPAEPLDFARFVAGERPRWQTLVAQRGITAEAGG